jgi:hypothetical protein
MFEELEIYKHLIMDGDHMLNDQVQLKSRAFLECFKDALNCI